jgi:hypothetical protein
VPSKRQNRVLCERLCCNLPLVGYRQKFLGIVDVVWQGIEVIDELGMARDLARLPAEKSLMLAARGADEFEGVLQVPETDWHGAAPGMAWRFQRWQDMSASVAIFMERDHPGGDPEKSPTAPS